MNSPAQEQSASILKSPLSTNSDSIPVQSLTLACVQASALETGDHQWRRRFESLATALPGASMILSSKGDVLQFHRGRESVASIEKLFKGFSIPLDLKGEQSKPVKEVNGVRSIDLTRRQSEAFKLALSGQSAKCHVNHQDPNGSGMRVIEQRFAPISGENGTPQEVALFARDVTDLVELKQSLRDLTERDCVTGSMTMASLIDYARLHVDCEASADRQIVFMSIEVDGFATGVHLLGNEAFEELLQGIYARISKSLPGVSAIARRGERNFVAVIEVDDAKKFAAEASLALVRELREPLVTGRKEHAMSVTVGYAIFPEDGLNADEMFRHADIAASNAQRSGRNAALQFRREMAQDAMDRAQLEARLYKAVENEEFTLAFQPKIQLIDGAVVGVEALLRWNGKNSISPAQFIPIAEECGLILYIGEWVLRQACKTAKRWYDEGIKLPISVNVSTRQFSDNNFHTIVGEILSETDCPSHLIDLEVTEGVMFIDPEAAIASCAKLKEMGLSISIDDFGMGFSSLSYLKSLPADCVKIDRTFIIGVPGDTDNAAIAKAIIAMAKAMEMLVVAEGVEEPSELNYLKDLGCDQVQGYLFSKPLFEADFMAWLEAYRHSLKAPQAATLNSQ